MSQGSAFYSGATRYGGSAANAKRREAARKAFFTFKTPAPSTSTASTANTGSTSRSTSIFNVPDIVSTYTINSDNIIRKEPPMPQLTTQAKKIFSWIQENSYAQQETFQITKRTNLKKHRFNPIAYRGVKLNKNFKIIDSTPAKQQQPITSQPPTLQPPPTKQPPCIQPSTTHLPTLHLPTIQPPIVQPSIVQPPTTQPSTTQPSTTQPSTTQPPSTQPRCEPAFSPTTVVSQTKKVPETSPPPKQPTPSQLLVTQSRPQPISTTAAPSTPVVPQIKKTVLPTPPKQPSKSGRFASPKPCAPVKSVSPVFVSPKSFARPKDMAVKVVGPPKTVDSNRKQLNSTPNQESKTLNENTKIIDSIPAKQPAATQPPVIQSVPEPKATILAAVTETKKTSTLPTLPKQHPLKSGRFASPKPCEPTRSVTPVFVLPKSFAQPRDLTVKVNPPKPVLESNNKQLNSTPNDEAKVLNKNNKIDDLTPAKQPTTIQAQSPPQLVASPTTVVTQDKKVLEPSPAKQPSSTQPSITQSKSEQITPAFDDVEMDIDAEPPTSLPVHLPLTTPTVPSFGTPTTPLATITPLAPVSTLVSSGVPTTQSLVTQSRPELSSPTTPVVSQPLFTLPPSFATPTFSSPIIPPVPNINSVSMPNGSNPFQPPTSSTRGRKILRPARRLPRN